MHASAARFTPVAPHWEGASVAYVLISYPIGVRWALAPLHGSYFERALAACVRGNADGGAAASHGNVFLAYGDRDQFTSAARYDAWCDALSQGAAAHGAPASVHTARMTADHFWATAAARRALQHALAAWLD